MIDIVIPKVRVKKAHYIRTVFQPYSIKNLVKMSKQHNIYYHFFKGKGKTFVMN